MVLERFDIVLDQSKTSKGPIYSAGQIVTGAVIARNQEKETLYGFYLEAYGRAKCEWSEGSGDDSRTISIKERYFRNKIPCDHQHPIGERFELHPGIHQYQFCFQLPADIPSSFDGKHGDVRYTLKAVMKRSWYKHDYICEIPIIVQSLVDLNAKLDEILEAPIKTESKKHMGFSMNGHITATARLDRSGYVPGETITFNAIIDNQSGRTVDGATVQLMRRDTYIAKKKKTTYKKILWEESRGKFRDGTSLVWHDFPIVVPNTVPSELPHCNIIDIEYEIKLIVDPGLLSSNLVVTLGVFIGTIPIHPFGTMSDDGTRDVPYGSPTNQISADCCGLDERDAEAKHTDPTAPLEALANLSIDPAKSAMLSNQLTADDPPPSYDECANTGVIAEVTEPFTLASEESDNNFCSTQF